MTSPHLIRDPPEFLPQQTQNRNLSIMSYLRSARLFTPLGVMVPFTLCPLLFGKLLSARFIGMLSLDPIDVKRDYEP